MTWSVRKSCLFPVKYILHSPRQCITRRPKLLTFKLVQSSHPLQIERVSLVKNSKKKVIRQKNPGVNIFIFDKKNFGLVGSVHILFIYKKVHQYALKQGHSHRKERGAQVGPFEVWVLTYAALRMFIKKFWAFNKG